MYREKLVDTHISFSSLIKRIFPLILVINLLILLLIEKSITSITQGDTIIISILLIILFIYFILAFKYTEILKTLKLLRLYILSTHKMIIFVVISFIITNILFSYSLYHISNTTQQTINVELDDPKMMDLVFNMHNFNYEASNTTISSIASPIFDIIEKRYEIKNIYYNYFYEDNLIINRYIDFENNTHYQFATLKIQMLSQQKIEVLKEYTNYNGPDNLENDQCVLVLPIESPNINYSLLINENMTISISNDNRSIISNNETLITFEQSISNNVYLDSDMQKSVKFYQIEAFTLFVSEENFWDLYFNTNYLSYKKIDVEIGVKLIIDDNLDLKKMYTDLNQIEVQFFGYFLSIENQHHTIFYHSQLYVKLNAIEENIWLINIAMLLILSPFMAFSVILLKKAMDGFLSKDKEYFLLLSKKGANIYSQVIIIILKNLMVSVVSILITVIIILIYSFVNNVDRFTLFQVIWQFSIISFVIAFNFGVSNVNKLIFTIDDNQADMNNTKDLVPFILGLAFIIILILFDNYIHVDYVLYVIISMTSNILLIIGISKIGSNIIKFSLPILLITSNKSNFKLIKIVHRNFYKFNKKISSFLSILTITFIIINLLVFLPLNLNETKIEKANYDTGADLAIQSYTNLSNYTSFLSQIDGIVDASLTKKSQAIFGNLDYYFLGINTTNFSNIAYWQSEYSDYNLENLTTNLSENSSVFMDFRSITEYNYKIDQEMVVYGEISGNLNYIPLILKGSFDLFPNLIQKQSYGNQPPKYIVSNLSTFDKISSKLQLGVTYEVYVNLDQDINIDKLVDEIYDYFEKIKISIKIDAVILTLNSNNNIFFVVQNTLQSLLPISIILFFAFVSINAYDYYYTRTFDFALLRAFGSTGKQIKQIQTIEFLYISLNALIFGSFMFLIVFHLYIQSLSRLLWSVPPLHNTISALAYLMTSLLILSPIMVNWIIGGSIGKNIMDSLRTE